MLLCKNCRESTAREGFDFCWSGCASEYESKLPKSAIEFEVCGRCQGHGTHTNPSIDGNGLTSDDIDRLGPDFMDDYMNGVYDVRCEKCNGQRVVQKTQSHLLLIMERAEDLRELRAEAPYLFN